jgi:hypothetical protein
MDFERSLRALTSSESDSEILAVLVSIRKALGVTKDPPIDACVKSGLIPHVLVRLQNGTPRIQEEAGWIITNIASGTAEHVRELMTYSAGPVLVNACRSPVPAVVKQSVWALGNMAGDGPLIRDYVIALSFVPILCGLLASPDFQEIEETLLWTASNLCRGRPAPAWHEVSTLLVPLAKCVLQTPTKYADAWWALSYLSDGPKVQLTVRPFSRASFRDQRSVL